MAFVPAPRNLNLIKSRVAFNLTKRQLISFSCAAVVGIPTYIFTSGTIGNDGGVILMIILMLPFFFIGMYERDGLPAEKVIRNYLRVRVFWPGKRPYKTENIYGEEALIETQDEIKTSRTRKAR